MLRVVTPWPPAGEDGGDFDWRAPKLYLVEGTVAEKAIEMKAVLQEFIVNGVNSGEQLMKQTVEMAKVWIKSFLPAFDIEGLDDKVLSVMSEFMTTWKSLICFMEPSELGYLRDCSAFLASPLSMLTVPSCALVVMKRVPLYNTAMTEWSNKGAATLANLGTLREISSRIAKDDISDEQFKEALKGCFELDQAIRSGMTDKMKSRLGELVASVVQGFEALAAGDGATEQLPDEAKASKCKSALGVLQVVESTMPELVDQMAQKINTTKKFVVALNSQAAQSVLLQKVGALDPAGLMKNPSTLR